MNRVHKILGTVLVGYVVKKILRSFSEHGKTDNKMPSKSASEDLLDTVAAKAREIGRTKWSQAVTKADAYLKTKSQNA